MTSSTKQKTRKIRGWIFDVYSAAFGEVAVWIITQNGERIRLTDPFKPKVYISATKPEDLQKLSSKLQANPAVSRWQFCRKYANPTDVEKSKVIEVTLKDARKIRVFTREILELGEYLTYELHNCELHGDRAYLFEHDLFPLAFVEVQVSPLGLEFSLLDSVRSLDYKLPDLRVMRLQLEIAKKGKIAGFDDPIRRIIVSQADKQVIVQADCEVEAIMQLVGVVEDFDPDIILTASGDSFLLPYLIHRANVNGALDRFLLNRDPTPFSLKKGKGRTFFSYGRTFYKAPTTRLFGRIHIDERNTFILNESSFEGLFEIARTCRVPLHTAARASIGSVMSSIQLYQAVKDDILIPRNKNIPETFKTAYELLVGDRGGFVYEPKVGIHEGIFEVDFSSMYPSLMVKNNISAETVLCKCCPDSKLRIPELGYHICEKRVGIVPKSLELVVSKRLAYKHLKETETDPKLKSAYDQRQAALKWILVTCFGYLGYKNAKFGTIDGHIGVCAFGREAFLKAARTAEMHGFSVIHGIVDSLWLKKEDASIEDIKRLCSQVTKEIGVPLNFEGRYNWIVFMPSKMHPNIGVLNRYYGVMDTGKLKLRGIAMRRHDTPRFLYDAQMQMIEVLSKAKDAKEFYERVPDALEVVRQFRRRLLRREVPVWDLVVSKRMSKDPAQYRQHVSQVIAAEQLLKEGTQVQAGTNVKFLFTNAQDKRFERRVKAAPLIEKGTNPDTKKYLLMLYDCAANLLSCAGYTAQSIYEQAITKQKQTKLP